MDEYRNYGDIALQRRCSFETDEVKWVVEPPLSRLILSVGPFFTDDRQQDATGSNTLVNRFAKIAPRLDRRDIHEHRVFAEVANKVVEQTSRFAFRVISTIADENSAHRNAPLGFAG